jgi:hypothetical protein
LFNLECRLPACSVLVIHGSVTMALAGYRCSATNALRLSPVLRRPWQVRSSVHEAQVARFKNDKLFAAVLGILLVAGPGLWLSTWLLKRGQPEISVAASWTVGNFEAQVDRAVAVLDELAEWGVDGCGPPELARLGRSMLTAGPVKALSVLDAGGQTLCTDRGVSLAHHELVSSTTTANRDVRLDVVRMAAGAEPMLRVRRQLSSSRASLAAVLPIELLLPQVASDGTPFAGFVRITFSDGTVVGATEPRLTAAETEALDNSSIQSSRYGAVVTAAMARDSAIASRGDLRRIGMAVTGLLVLILLVTALMVPWSDHGVQTGRLPMRLWGSRSLYLSYTRLALHFRQILPPQSF